MFDIVIDHSCVLVIASIHSDDATDGEEGYGMRVNNAKDLERLLDLLH